jgi:hypothetical protein
MTPVVLSSSLSHRLLVAISRAHLAGDPPPDWQECAAAASVSARQATISRALACLANEGLIEGLLTSEGWFMLRPTARGLARAGRDAHPSSDGGRAAAATAATHVYRSPAERVTVTVEEVSAEMRTLSEYARIGWQRAREAMTPRLIAMRTTMINTWHMFTTFP